LGASSDCVLGSFTFCVCGGGCDDSDVIPAAAQATKPANVVAIHIRLSIL
jgi:hypothetical protein